MQRRDRVTILEAVEEWEQLQLCVHIVQVQADYLAVVDGYELLDEVSGVEAHIFKR